MTYTFDFISSELKSIIEPATLQSHKFEKQLGCRMYKNAYVAPYFKWDKSIGCVIDEFGHVVKDSECEEWKEDESFYNINEAATENKRVIYLGFLVTVFGHSFTDDLRKLWFLHTDECKRLVADGWKLVFTTSWNRPIPDCLTTVFQLAGFDISCAEHIMSITRFDQVCVPENSLIADECGRKCCPEYRKAIETIRSTVPNTDERFSKLYFTRSRFSHGSKKEYGEKAIERVFKNHGYTIVVPEDYSIVEQIQMVQNCDCFAATEGSVAHLSLFCRPGTQVTIINKANYLNFHQVMINEYADLNVTYIEAHHSSNVDLLHPWWGPFYLCVNGFLERYFRHPILHLPYWALPSYWEYSRSIVYRIYNRIRKIVKNVL